METWIKNVLKLAGFIFTAQATLAVAAQLNPDKGIATLAAQGAGLILAEGVMMLGWWMLDNKPDASTAQRWLYSAMAIVGFIDLAIIAVAHGEGLAGWAFRAPLLVLIVYSIAESGILAGIHLDSLADRDILKDWSVRRHAVKLARLEAKHEREAMSAVRVAFLEAEQSGGLHAAGLYSQRLQAENDASHNTQSVITHNATHNIPRKWDTWVDPRVRSKESKKSQAAAILKDDPTITNYELAKQIGVTDTTVGRYKRELAADNGRSGGYKSADTLRDLLQQ